MRNRSTWWWARVAGVLVVVALGVLLAVEWPLTAQSPSSPTPDTGVFTPAHSTIGASLRDFFNVHSTPEQPIAFTHKAHLAKGLVCQNCHVGVDTGAEPRIPNVSFCMTCHIAIDTNNPVIKQVAAYQARGEDIPWQRVYDFEPEYHVRFNHEPHIRAGVNCSTCHGDMTQATVARRTVNLTMGFCVTCHRQEKVSVDCVTCHF